MQGFQDSPLSETGTEQAQALGRRLAGKPYDAVYSSDAGRCVRTARIALDGANVPIRQLAELRERNLGDWEGLRWQDIVAADPEPARLYRVSAEFRPPNGETFLELRNRVMGAIVEITRAHAGQRVLIFTSGGSVRAAVFGAMNFQGETWSGLSAWNTGITRLERRDDVWKLTGFNDVSHLGDSVGGHKLFL